MNKLQQLSLPVLSLLLVSLSLYGQDATLDGYGPKPQHSENVNQWTADQRRQFGEDQHVLVLPGLVADRQRTRVEFLVESTGLGRQDATEFLVVDASSFHGYEALFWSHARPSAVHRALEFIGLVPGIGQNPDQLRFWSKGELIAATVRPLAGDQAPMRLETLIFDRETGAPLPPRGFIFIGSQQVTDPQGLGETVYAADKYGSRTIISVFNDSLAVLDVNWEISREEAYRSYSANPESLLPPNELYLLVLEPVAKDGRTPVRNLTLMVQDRQTFVLQENETGQQVVPETTVSAALETCRKMVEDGLRPYVTLRFSDNLRLWEIQSVCLAMAMLDQPGAIRIEPPLPGRLYYRSFLPNPRWRTPTNRPSQAWEVHLEKIDNKLVGTLLLHEPTAQSGGGSEPEFNIRRETAADAEALRRILEDDAAARKANKQRPLPQVLMVYAPADLSYGELLAFLAPAMQTHNTIHLFLEATPGTRNK